MKIIYALLLTLTLSVFSQAADSVAETFLSLDLFTAANAYEKDKNSLGGLVDAASALGWDSAAAKMSISGSWGLRGGALWPISGTQTRLGGSFGYIAGPGSELTLTLSDPIGGNPIITETNKTSYLRMLLEIKHRLPLGKTTSIDAGGGLGIANGKMVKETVCNGSGCANPGSISEMHESSTGLTWELSPRLNIQMTRKSNLGLGVRYAGFPKMKETDDFNEFEWTPFGLFLEFTHMIF